MHRHFFLVSYQLLLVSADNGFSKRNWKKNWKKPSPSQFRPTSLYTDATSRKTDRGERYIYFFKGVGAAAVHRLGPTGNGFSLLSVTENNVLCGMQGCIKNLSNFNLFTGNFRYACNCTSYPINLWRSVVTKRKGSQGPDQEGGAVSRVNIGVIDDSVTDKYLKTIETPPPSWS